MIFIRSFRIVPAVAAALFVLSNLAALSGQEKKRKKDDPGYLQIDAVEQKVNPVASPPTALTVDTARLEFTTSAPSPKRLLSDQVEAALRDVYSKAHGGRVVKLRAFVAGTGDMRQIQISLIEFCNSRRIPLPVLSIVQVGALPYRDAQVIIESSSVSKDAENAHGLAFISGQPAVAPEMTFEIAPLVELSVKRVKTALAAAGLEASDALRLTCFVSALEDSQEVLSLLAKEFPQAARNVVQLQRAPSVSLAECEAVARLSSAPAEPVVHLSPGSLASESDNYAQLVLVNTPQLVLTGSQLAFRYEEQDARMAFERLSKTLESNKTSTRNIVMANVYPLSSRIAETVRKVRGEFIDRTRPPAGTMLTFQGLPSLDAAFSLEVVAVPQH